MANIGQLYYRVPIGTDDDGTVIYSTSTQLATSFFGVNLVGLMGTSAWTKVGIQAPPGTQMVMNGIKEILMGRTGIYELDEDISITDLQFKQPQNYIEDTDQEERAKNDGLKAIEDAMNAREMAYLKWTAGLASSWLEIKEKSQETEQQILALEDELKILNQELETLKEELETIEDKGSKEYQDKQKEIADKETEISTKETEKTTIEKAKAILDECLAKEPKMIEIETAYQKSYDLGWGEYNRGVNGIYKAGTPGDLDNVIIDYIYE